MNSKVAPLPRSKPKPKHEVFTATRVICVVLKLSRLVFISPVMVKEIGGRKRITMSDPLYCFHMIITTLIILAALTGVVFDYSLDHKDSVRLLTPTMRMAWLTDFNSLLITSSIGGYGGFRRTKEMLECMRDLQKVTMTLNIKYPKPAEENKKIVYLLSFLSVVVILLGIDYVLLFTSGSRNEVSVVVCCLYSTYEISGFMIFALEVSFVASAFEVHAVLKELNNVLENILDIKTNNQVSRDLKPVERKIRNVMYMYDVICSIVKKLSDANGLSLAALLITLFTKLVITPYNLVKSFDENKRSPLLWIIFLLSWTITLLISIILLVQPAQATQTEVAHTNVLVSKLTNNFKDKIITNELNKFSLYLQLNQVTYSPLGICTLSRSLISTIVGMATTYLVIMIQFRTFDVQ